jgi:type II secretory ATPase GspE/PulE/Tfp pilus assembly ATPase PilB-like protein
MLTATETMRELAMQRAPVSEFERAAAEAKSPTMLDDGLAKVAAGMTTLEELERVGVLSI